MTASQFGNQNHFFRVSVDALWALNQHSVVTQTTNVTLPSVSVLHIPCSSSICTLSLKSIVCPCPQIDFNETLYGKPLLILSKRFDIIWFILRPTSHKRLRIFFYLMRSWIQVLRIQKYSYTCFVLRIFDTQMTHFSLIIHRRLT
jgi:hypothetical protein